MSDTPLSMRVWKPRMTASRRRGQEHVRFGDGADGAVDDFQADLVRFDLLERLDDGLDRALRVGLDDHLEHLGRRWSPVVAKRFSSVTLARASWPRARASMRALLGQVAGVLLVFDAR